MPPAPISAQLGTTDPPAQPSNATDHPNPQAAPELAQFLTTEAQNDSALPATR